MLALYILSSVAVGAVAGIAVSMRLILNAINRADICHEDRTFIRGVLGITQGEQ